MKTVIDVENAAAADLKAKGAEAVAAAKTASHDDLAERFVDARFDAKIRDEKLGEVARTNAALEQGQQLAGEKIQALEAKVLQRESNVRSLEAEKRDLQAIIARIRDESAKALADLREQLSAETARADAAAALAKARRKALADITGVANPLLAQE